MTDSSPLKKGSDPLDGVEKQGKTGCPERVGPLFQRADRRSLTDLAKEIWQAGVDAVSSERLVGAAIQRESNRLTVCGHEFDVEQLGRLVVVGTGKAGAGMAAAVEDSVGEDLLARTVGFVNVPEDCVRPLQKIVLHGARPAGVNEPVQAGVDGAAKILELVASLTENDLCLVLISGGGSALLPAPIEGVSLEDKQTVTRLLMHGGATINELNCVRKQLSRIKGGGLARAAKQGTLITLVISDVIGDPLDVIASGPTVADESSPEDAIAILNRLVPSTAQIPAAVMMTLQKMSEHQSAASPIDASRVHNVILGRNQVAVDAAATRARELGFPVETESEQEGVAAEFGRDLARKCLAVRRGHSSSSVCLISGGEPTVRLAETDEPRKGGRNQELVLAACDELGDDDGRGIVILSGGTDGEDGPTDAAGAWLDADVLSEMRSRQLDPKSFLAINNSYPFFQQTGGLLLTGPTHTNVMDLRIALVDPRGA
jgi:glycerate 2-kinase